MNLMQGSTYILELQIKEDGVPINIENVEKIQVILGAVEKEYPKDIDYVESKFIINLSQEDTFKLKDLVQQQIRVKFTDGQVKSSAVDRVNVLSSITRKVL